ncbi:MAG TPA: polysaccharide biosynthesis C-terminal domain-containing protein, partial [Anaerolineales bacterium]|nr:polysaccharide biosynthesis C-terminal domain-containing protein [Anaerolineales bacterium]
FISYDLIARGLENTLVKATAISLVLFLGLYLWLIPMYQLNGAIYAALVGEIIQTVIFITYHRRGGVTPPLHTNEKYS